MLGHWFERGLGQIVAPDPIHEASIHHDGNIDKNNENEEEEEEEEKGLLDILAPEDPNYKRLRRTLEDKDRALEIQRPQSPPTVIRTKMEEDGIMVRCTHCHKLTPTGLSSPIRGKKAAMISSQGDVVSTPVPQSKKEESSTNEIIAITPSHRTLHPTPLLEQSNNTQLQAQVLNAAKGTAITLSSPTPTWESIKNIFILCTNTTKTMNDKKLKKLSKSFVKNPCHVNSRSQGMGHLIPDGFTPLHAAAYAGNGKVVQLLIDLNSKKEEAGGVKVDFDVRDLQGRSALHIAAEKGHVEIVQLLKTAMTTTTTSSSPFSSSSLPVRIEPVGKDAPTDLTGRTPLAYAATSKEAFKHRTEIESMLFSPGDESVCGIFSPPCDRGGGAGRNLLEDIEEKKKISTTTKLEFGFAEMPGYRIEMEDALCCHYPLVSSSSSQTTDLGLFGVFDGHGDGGLVSKYLANNLASILTSTTEYKSHSGGDVNGLTQMLLSSCPILDDGIKKQDFVRGGGGSTAVMALISEEAIAVGNVGDSRCILVQYGCSGETTNDNEADDNNNVQGLVEGVSNLAVSEVEEDKEKMEEREKTSEKNEKEVKNSKIDEHVIKITELSEDHKPNLPEERARIERSGMLVMPEVFRDDTQKKKKKESSESKVIEEKDNEDDDEEEELYTTIWKIQKSDTEKIAVSRAFGDFDYKNNEELKASEQAVVCTPDIRSHIRDADKDAFLIMACDGIWDVMSNEEVGTFVWNKTREFLRGGESDSDDDIGDGRGVVGDDSNLEKDGKSGIGPDGGRIKSPALRGSAEDLPSSPSPSLVLPIVGDKLIEECLRRGSRDNMTVLIISLSLGVVTTGISSSLTTMNAAAAGGSVDVNRAIDFADE